VTGLRDDQLDRYARHIVLKEIGGEGQSKLLDAHVVLVGAGGIGSPAIQYLAAAGMGRLTVIDDDRVSLDNLQRQTLFGTADVGRLKVEVAAEAVARLNPDTRLTGIAERLTQANAARLLGEAGLVLDGSDNFATRLTVSDRCTAARIPLVSAAVGRFQAQVGTFTGWLPGSPCYRCFVGDAFDSEDCDNCAELGVLGAMVGLAGSFAALEAVRHVAGFGEPSTGKLHVFDGLAPAMRTLRIVKDPGCRACGSGIEPVRRASRAGARAKPAGPRLRAGRRPGSGGPPAPAAGEAKGRARSAAGSRGRTGPSLRAAEGRARRSLSERAANGHRIKAVRAAVAPTPMKRLMTEPRGFISSSAPASSRLWRPCGPCPSPAGPWRRARRSAARLPRASAGRAPATWAKWRWSCRR
jgi:molybdopterin/thiamine biosynthesis adenylyltransferase